MRLVIFDMDGVLLDSEPYWQAAELEVFAAHGLHLTAEQTQETIGLRASDDDELVGLDQSQHAESAYQA